MSKRGVEFGPRIGSYMGKPIFKSFRDQRGTYIFDRIANYSDDGYPLDQLSKSELMVDGGLIYRREG